MLEFANYENDHALNIESVDTVFGKDIKYVPATYHDKYYTLYFYNTGGVVDASQIKSFATKPIGDKRAVHYFGYMEDNIPYMAEIETEQGHVVKTTKYRYLYDAPHNALEKDRTDQLAKEHGEALLDSTEKKPDRLKELFAKIEGPLGSTKVVYTAGPVEKSHYLLTLDLKSGSITRKLRTNRGYFILPDNFVLVSDKIKSVDMFLFDFDYTLLKIHSVGLVTGQKVLYGTKPQEAIQNAVTQVNSISVVDLPKYYSDYEFLRHIIPVLVDVYKKKVGIISFGFRDVILAFMNRLLGKPYFTDENVITGRLLATDKATGQITTNLVGNRIINEGSDRIITIGADGGQKVLAIDKRIMVGILTGKYNVQDPKKVVFFDDSAPVIANMKQTYPYSFRVMEGRENGGGVTEITFYSSLQNVVIVAQHGGGQRNKYQKKYLKYKLKYLSLKRQ